MDELDGGGAGHDVRRRGRVGAGRGVARAQRQHRPEPLAARAEQVPGDFAEEPILGLDRLGQAFLDPHQVVG